MTSPQFERTTPTPTKPDYEPRVHADVEGDEAENDSLRQEQKNKSRRNKIIMGTVAATAAAAVAIGFGYSGNSSAEQGKKQPGITETLSPDSSTEPQAVSTAEFGSPEATQDALDGKLANPNTFPNPDWPNFPFQLGGKQYESRKDFIDAMSFSIEDYPDPEDAIKQMIDEGLNRWLQSGLDVGELKKFALYQPEDGGMHSSILETNYYDPAFKKALGPGIERFQEMRNDYGVRKLLTMNDDTPYKGGYEYVRRRTYMQEGLPDEKGFGYSSFLTMKFKDNGDETAIGEKLERYSSVIVNLRTEKRDGEIYWTIESINSSNFLPQDENGNDIFDNSLEESGY